MSRCNLRMTFEHHQNEPPFILLCVRARKKNLLKLGQFVHEKETLSIMYCCLVQRHRV